jgi:glycosyltransferase involved in cell wall biosynthesis
MKIFAIPRETNNPYQELLYGEMRHYGAQVVYAGQLTRSYTLNLLLMPFELLLRRVAGVRLAHLHWTYNFCIYGSSKFPFLRCVAQWWFYACLWTLKVLGMRLIWTAHNVLPAGRVLADDLQARRRMVSTADLVIAHSQATLDELATLGIIPRRSLVIPHGPYVVTGGAESLRVPGVVPGHRKFMFFGTISSYKGIDTLLAAFAALPSDLPVELDVVGECVDAVLKASLTQLAVRSQRQVTLRFERIAESEVSSLLADADVIVLPYRKITTSGSAVLALTHGRPLVVPDLPGLAGIPDDAVVRYDGTARGLTNALADLATADAGVLAKMSAAGYAYCASTSWSSIAKVIFDEMSRILSVG